MCFKKWFHPVVVPQPKKRRALLWAINNYPGTGNDLAGCLNDMKDIAARLITKWPDFEVNSYPDSYVTRNRFVTEVGNAISVLRPNDWLFLSYSGHGTQVTDKDGDETGYDEALYLYDGPLVDDEINKLLKKIPDGANVVCFFDSCFSGTVTRKTFDGLPKKNRFMQTPGVPIQTNAKKRMAGIDSNWITFSACGECQTSADAFFNGRANGAGSYYFLKSLTSATSKKIYEQFRCFLPSNDFSQIPELEGNEVLLNKIIFT